MAAMGWFAATGFWLIKLSGTARGGREGRLQQRIRFFCRPSLLIVDEIGYLPVVTGGGNLSDTAGRQKAWPAAYVSIQRRGAFRRMEGI